MIGAYDGQFRNKRVERWDPATGRRTIVFTLPDGGSLGGQLVRADRILTGTLEAVEEAGSQFKHSVWRPMQKASALVQGIKVGIDLLRARRGPSSRRDEAAEHEEELFI